MIDITQLRNQQNGVIAIGTYPAIIQSMLDFDFASEKTEPSVKAIISEGRNNERYFWGDSEILIPVISDPDELDENTKNKLTFFVNFSSGRRTLSSTILILEKIPNLIGGALFAEKVPEQHTLAIYQKAKELGKTIIGPASIGLLIPGKVKLGAIAGTDIRQLVSTSVFQSGSVAVLSASGGMTNELINAVTKSGKRLSFSLAFGGERFPITTPTDAFLAAEKDEQTQFIVYFGELGGTDEADVANLLQTKQVTKPVFAYVAGSVAEMFETPPQFGHAKAMAKTENETAKAKRELLRNAGAHVADSFTEFLELIDGIPSDRIEDHDYTPLSQTLSKRHHALFVSTISGDLKGHTQLLHEDILPFVQERSFAAIVCSLFLGKPKISPELESFVDFVLRLLVDHGPQVSGAVNTMITARAGRDMVSSLVTGLLTIGPRFGGAINEAAANLLLGIETNQDPSDFVERFAQEGKKIAGIGHRKYRIDLPDPRVAALKEFADKLETKRFISYALAIEKITTQKKGNLILNVDGAIAATLLDILSEKEGFTDKQLLELVDREFFNAFFILSRSVGFLSHFMDQKRLDEGIFRLPDELVLHV